MQTGRKEFELGRNYFELFELPLTFDIDNADLSARYRDLQRRFHPDRYVSASDQDRRLSLQMTAFINEAYHTLNDPLARGRYILGLHGMGTDEETDTVMDPGFLVEQMELRENLEDARRAPDAALRLAQLAEDMARRLATAAAELGRRLHEDSAASRLRARSIVREMQFLRKVLQEIEELELSA